MHTPWGASQSTHECADGIMDIGTARHGGLKISPERWAELPSEVTDIFQYKGWAEEDCETPIALTIFGRSVISETDMDMDRANKLALQMTDFFERYRPLKPLIEQAIARDTA